MAAPYPGGSTLPGLRASPRAGRGLQYKPISPWQQAGAGGLQGLGAYLMALGAGQPQQAPAAFQAALAGADDAQYRRAEQAERQEDRDYRRQEREATAAERERLRADKEAAKVKFGEFSALFSDADPANDPSSLQDLLPYLDPDQGYGVVADMLKPRDPVKGIEIGGMLVNPITGEPIADFSEQELRLRTAGRPQTTVNMGPTGIDYGEPEKGLAWARNPDGTVRLDQRGAPIALPYQGGSVYSAEQEAEQKQAGSDKSKKLTATIVTDDIRRAKDIIKNATLPATGLIGDWLKDTGNTSANDLRATLTTIKANIGFDKLQDMRNNSPTGGALGPVSDVENALLQSTYGSLEQSQTADQFIYNLDRLNTIYDEIINGPRARNKDDDARPSTVIDGYTIRPK